MCNSHEILPLNQEIFRNKVALKLQRVVPYDFHLQQITISGLKSKLIQDKKSTFKNAELKRTYFSSFLMSAPSQISLIDTCHHPLERHLASTHNLQTEKPKLPIRLSLQGTITLLLHLKRHPDQRAIHYPISKS